MFVFSDPEPAQAVVAAHHRGVKVRVMLNPARRSGEDDNEEVRKALEHAGHRRERQQSAFGITHEKSMVVDEAGRVREIAQLGDQEPDRNPRLRRSSPRTRTGRAKSSRASTPTGTGHDFKPGESAHLIWCPANGRERIAQFIDEAKHTLFVQNERYQDPVIIERLVRARTRREGPLMARPPHTLKKEKIIEGVGGMRIMDDVGIKIHKLKHLKLHGKMLLADGLRAIVGSINLAPGSFDSRRELAIEVRDEQIVDRLSKVVHADWDNSHPLDLSDDGLLKDLGDENEDAVARLGLDAPEHHHNHNHEHKHHHEKEHKNHGS